MLIEPSSICKLPDQKHVFTAAGPNPRGEYQRRRRFGTCRLGIVPSVRIQSDPIRQATIPSASGCRMAPLHGAFTAPHGDRCSPCLALNGTELRRAHPCSTLGLAGMRWPVSARNQDGQLEHPSTTKLVGSARRSRPALASPTAHYAGHDARGEPTGARIPAGSLAQCRLRGAAMHELQLRCVRRCVGYL